MAEFHSAGRAPEILQELSRRKSAGEDLELCPVAKARIDALSDAQFDKFAAKYGISNGLADRPGTTERLLIRGLGEEFHLAGVV